uniref:MYND-type domain-containing protein n=1 Tax=Chromera velia CCMP2878 TaxID=1169474 RepID=A0A0G4I8F8_9ALVE|eukprot:Cvel_11849.t1-p1 / transcript=Cvel_11849.t1 / gene=Cvel_11849 / organism=Chromera_velia_CCMP2878 / gene_product=hypothetical protein / transcript_product=hypothetical protein / location=Cvel_scaffold755:49655-58276(+) / protein_length=2253 / sequence_SO=supercontig / SO=protein_coding / is_pseudo=false
MAPIRPKSPPDQSSRPDRKKKNDNAKKPARANDKNGNTAASRKLPKPSRHATSIFRMQCGSSPAQLDYEFPVSNAIPPQHPTATYVDRLSRDLGPLCNSEDYQIITEVFEAIPGDQFHHAGARFLEAGGVLHIFRRMWEVSTSRYRHKLLPSSAGTKETEKTSQQRTQTGALPPPTVADCFPCPHLLLATLPHMNVGLLRLLNRLHGPSVLCFWSCLLSLLPLESAFADLDSAGLLLCSSRACLGWMRLVLQESYCHALCKLCEAGAEGEEGSASPPNNKETGRPPAPAETLRLPEVRWAASVEREIVMREANLLSGAIAEQTGFSVVPARPVLHRSFDSCVHSLDRPVLLSVERLGPSGAPGGVVNSVRALLESISREVLGQREEQENKKKEGEGKNQTSIFTHFLSLFAFQTGKEFTEGVTHAEGGEGKEEIDLLSRLADREGSFKEEVSTKVAGRVVQLLREGLEGRGERSEEKKSEEARGVEDRAVWPPHVGFVEEGNHTVVSASLPSSSPSSSSSSVTQRSPYLPLRPAPLPPPSLRAPLGIFRHGRHRSPSPPRVSPSSSSRKEKEKKKEKEAGGSSSREEEVVEKGKEKEKKSFSGHFWDSSTMASLWADGKGGSPLESLLTKKETGKQDEKRNGEAAAGSAQDNVVVRERRDARKELEGGQSECEKESKKKKKEADSAAKTCQEKEKDPCAKESRPIYSTGTRLPLKNALSFHREIISRQLPLLLVLLDSGIFQITQESVHSYLSSMGSRSTQNPTTPSAAPDKTPSSANHPPPPAPPVQPPSKTKNENSTITPIPNIQQKNKQGDKYPAPPSSASNIPGPPSAPHPPQIPTKGLRRNLIVPISPPGPPSVPSEPGHTKKKGGAEGPAVSADVPPLAAASACNSQSSANPKTGPAPSRQNGSAPPRLGVPVSLSHSLDHPCLWHTGLIGQKLQNLLKPEVWEEVASKRQSRRPAGLGGVSALEASGGSAALCAVEWLWELEAMFCGFLDMLLGFVAWCPAEDLEGFSRKETGAVGTKASSREGGKHFSRVSMLQGKGGDRKRLHGFGAFGILGHVLRALSPGPGGECDGVCQGTFRQPESLTGRLLLIAAVALWRFHCLAPFPHQTQGGGPFFSAPRTPPSETAGEDENFVETMGGQKERSEETLKGEKEKRLQGSVRHKVLFSTGVREGENQNSRSISVPCVHLRSGPVPKDQDFLVQTIDQSVARIRQIMATETKARAKVPRVDGKKEREGCRLISGKQATSSLQAATRQPTDTTTVTHPKPDAPPEPAPTLPTRSFAAGLGKERDAEGFQERETVIELSDDDSTGQESGQEEDMGLRRGEKAVEKEAVWPVDEAASEYSDVVVSLELEEEEEEGEGKDPWLAQRAVGGDSESEKGVCPVEGPPVLGRVESSMKCDHRSVQAAEKLSAEAIPDNSRERRKEEGRADAPVASSKEKEKEKDSQIPSFSSDVSGGGFLPLSLVSEFALLADTHALWGQEAAHIPSASFPTSYCGVSDKERGERKTERKESSTGTEKRGPLSPQTSQTAKGSTPRSHAEMLLESLKAAAKTQTSCDRPAPPHSEPGPSVATREPWYLPPSFSVRKLFKINRSLIPSLGHLRLPVDPSSSSPVPLGDSPSDIRSADFVWLCALSLRAVCNSIIAERGGEFDALCAAERNRHSPDSICFSRDVGGGTCLPVPTGRLCLPSSRDCPITPVDLTKTGCIVQKESWKLSWGPDRGVGVNGSSSSETPEAVSEGDNRSGCTVRVSLSVVRQPEVEEKSGRPEGSQETERGVSQESSGGTAEGKVPSIEEEERLRESAPEASPDGSPSSFFETQNPLLLSEKEGERHRKESKGPFGFCLDESVEDSPLVLSGTDSETEKEMDIDMPMMLERERGTAAVHDLDSASSSSAVCRVKVPQEPSAVSLRKVSCNEVVAAAVPSRSGSAARERDCLLSPVLPSFEGEGGREAAAGLEGANLVIPDSDDIVLSLSSSSSSSAPASLPASPQRDTPTCRVSGGENTPAHAIVQPRAHYTLPPPPIALRSPHTARTLTSNSNAVEEKTLTGLSSGGKNSKSRKDEVEKKGGKGEGKRKVPCLDENVVDISGEGVEERRKDSWRQSTAEARLNKDGDPVAPSASNPVDSICPGLSSPWHSGVATASSVLSRVSAGRSREDPDSGLQALSRLTGLTITPLGLCVSRSASTPCFFRQRPCSRPGCLRVEKRPRHFSTCSQCKMTVYCSEECQRIHWKHHQKACRVAKDPPAFFL